MYAKCPCQLVLYIQSLLTIIVSAVYVNGPYYLELYVQMDRIRSALYAKRTLLFSVLHANGPYYVVLSLKLTLLTI